MVQRVLVTEGAIDSDMNVFPPEGVTVVISNDTVTVTNQVVDIGTDEDLSDEDEGEEGDGVNGDEQGGGEEGGGEESGGEESGGEESGGEEPAE